VRITAGRAVEPQASVRVGDLAPDFTLAAVGREGFISLADYREQAPLLLVINRGLWCSFCRRYLVQLGDPREKLRRLGVELLAIVAATRERAEFYIEHRPIRVPLAADPDFVTHRAYGLSKPPMTPEMEQIWAAMQLRLDQTAMNPAELSELAEAVRSVQGAPTLDPGQPVPLNDFREAQNRLYPYEPSDSDKDARARNVTLPTGQFLIDRQGIVRWCKIQGVTQPPATLGNFPNEEELLAAASGLVG
jgi:peroxiredoxin